MRTSSSPRYGTNTDHGTIAWAVDPFTGMSTVICSLTATVENHKHAMKYPQIQKETFACLLEKGLISLYENW